MLGEGGQEGVVVNDFSGGETDFPLAGNPKQSAKLTNFLIREDNKAFIRNGSEIFDTTTKTNNSSSFMSVVKPSGATTHLTFSQDGTLFVNTRHKVFTQSGTTWSELKNDTNSMQCLQYSGASGTYTDAARACSDFFGNDTYLFPHEGDTLFSPASVLTDDAGSLSIRSFGLPTPTKYLYVSSSAVTTKYEDTVTFYNIVAEKFAKHALNTYNAVDHAAAQSGGVAASFDADVIVYNLATTVSFDDLQEQVEYLHGCVFRHMKDARVNSVSAVLHYNAGAYNTGALSFYPDVFQRDRSLKTLFDAIYNIALVLDLHILDFYVSTSLPFRHIDTTSARTSLESYLWFTSEPIFETETYSSVKQRKAGLHPLGAALKDLYTAGKFVAGTVGTAYEYVRTLLASAYPSTGYAGYPFDHLVFMGVALTYNNWASFGTPDPLYGMGDITTALSTVIKLYAPNRYTTADAALLAQQVDSVITIYQGSPSSKTYYSFTVKTTSIRTLLSRTFVDSKGTEYKEYSGFSEILYEAHVDTWKNASPAKDLRVNSIQYANVPVVPTTSNITNASQEIYRYSDTTLNFHLVRSFPASNAFGVFSGADVETDTTLITRQPDYTSDGTVEDGNIFSCDSFFIANNAGWAVCPTEYDESTETATYSFKKYKNRLRQSIQNSPTSFPYDFYFDFKENLVCGGHILNKPIVISEKAVYRVDGIFAEDGSGAIIPEKIFSLSGGVSSKGAISINDKVFFAGEDGFYMTDGYQCIPISGNLKARYATIEKSKTKAVFSKEENSIYWLISYASTGYSEIWVLNLEKPISDSSCFTVLTGKDSNMLAPCATFSDEGELIRGDKDGFIFIHRNSLLADPRINRTTHELSRAASGAILSDYIPFDYRSLHHSFGTTNERKYVTQYSFAIENLSPETSESFTAQPYYSNDKDRLTVGSSGYVPLLPVRIETSTAGIFSGKRLFSAGGLRCLYKQIGFTNGSVKICDSASVGASGSSVGTAFVLDGPKTFPYSDLVGCYLYTELDNYLTGYEIVANSANTLVFASALPSIVSLAWKITGVPKTERFAIVEVNIPMVKFGTVEQNQKDSPT